MAVKQRLWDWPVRICHWSMVILIAACWWTAEEHEIVYHSYCAYALLGVVLFRIYWGFFGSSTARFSQFVRKPSAVLAYLKTLGQGYVKAASGHNPLGGYSVLALLFVVLLQIGLGLFAIDVDGFDGGPFADYLKLKTSRMITGWHEITFSRVAGVYRPAYCGDCLLPHLAPPKPHRLHAPRQSSCTHQFAHAIRQLVTRCYRHSVCGSSSVVDYLSHYRFA